MYQYFIYGLGIQSELKLYSLEEYPGITQDVTVHYGRVGEDITARINAGIASSMNGERVWFRNDYGIFVILHGDEILIQAEEGTTEQEAASFVLGWCIAFLFQQRGSSAIHCSALEMKNQAVLIAGGSGAGKSTITLSLLNAGYRYLADDIAMVNPDNDFLIQPAFPQQKVCRNVAEGMNDNNLYYIDERKDKFALVNKQDFCQTPQKLTTIFLLYQYEGEAVKVERLKGLAKWNGIMNHLFLRDAYLSFGFPAEERDRCLKIAGNVEIYSIHRPKSKDTVAEICDTINRLVK